MLALVILFLGGTISAQEEETIKDTVQIEAEPVDTKDESVQSETIKDNAEPEDKFAELENSEQEAEDEKLQQAELFVLENMVEELAIEKEDVEGEKEEEQDEEEDIGKVDVVDLFGLDDLPVLEETSDEDVKENGQSSNGDEDSSESVTENANDTEAQAESEVESEKEVEPVLNDSEEIEEPKQDSLETEEFIVVERDGSSEEEPSENENEIEAINDQDANTDDEKELDLLDNTQENTSTQDDEPGTTKKTQKIRTKNSTVIQTISSQGLGESSSSSSSGISRRNSVTRGSDKLVQVNGDSSQGDETVKFGESFTLDEENQKRKEDMMNSIFGDEGASGALDNLGDQIKEEGNGDFENLTVNFNELSKGLSGEANPDSLVGNDFQVPSIQTSDFGTQFDIKDIPFGRIGTSFFFVFDLWDFKR